MSPQERRTARAGLLFCFLAVLGAFLFAAAPMPQMADDILWRGDAQAQAQATVGANGSATGVYGLRMLSSDGTTDHWVGSDLNGNVYTFDRSTDDVRLEINIRANTGLKTKFVSAPIDFRRFGVWKNVAIRAVGPTTLSTASIYVGLEGAASSVMDSTSSFPFYLGSCNPAGTGSGMRVVYSNATVLSDSTIVARPAQLIPLVDSTCGAPFVAPYGRFIVQTTSTQANNLYLHLFGGLR